MRDTVRHLVEALQMRRPVAYCRLVETRGSTPQKAGALMLVFADGSQAGTLGGGCVEAEVKRRALAVLDSGQAEVARFQLDSDYGWDDGLICGGRMLVLVTPVLDDLAIEYFQRLAQLVAEGQGITEAIAFDEEASGRAVPASFLFDAERRLVASLGVGADDPAAVSAVAEGAADLAERRRPWAERGVAYLPVLPRCRLLIVGGGHVGQAVAQLASDLDFDVWVLDDREDMVSEERFPRAEQRLVGTADDVLPTLTIRPDTYCIIVTRGHNHDEQALYHLADRGARYVGMIGSRRKIKLIYDDLIEQGVSADALERVHAPLGIDIGSQTVPEIAVSICAELVAHRNRNGQVPGRPAGVTVHAESGSPPA